MNRNFKRIVYILLVTTAILLLCSCSSKNKILTEADYQGFLEKYSEFTFIGKGADNQIIIGMKDLGIGLPGELRSRDDITLVKSSEFVMFNDEIEPGENPVYLPFETKSVSLNWPNDFNRKGIWRPAPGGVSIGHPNVTAGTLGGRVCYPGYGCNCFITNCHVAGCFNKAEIGDSIWQPGRYDGGSENHDIGKLVLKVKPSQNGTNYVDAALICDGNTMIYPEIFGIGQVNTYSTDVFVDLPVRKSGRTSEITHFKAAATEVCAKVLYRSIDGGATSYYFCGQILFEGHDTTSLPGDSGSWILTETDPPIFVSLLFAGNEDNQTLGNPAQDVFDAIPNMYLPGMLVEYNNPYP